MRNRFAGVLVVALIATSCGSGITQTSSENTEVTVTEVQQISVTDLTNAHVDNPPATFPNSPALGGDHYPFWMNCGFYEVEVIEGAAVHSLEHGAVWLTYSSSATDADVAWLKDQAGDNDRLLVSPYDHEEAIVATAWGQQLRGDLSAESPELVQFIESRVDHPDAPEDGVSCDGVVGVPPSDVRTLVADGSELPPEWE